MMIPFKTVLTSLVVGAVVALAADAAKKTTKAKPYPLETCVVSGEKLGGMGEPFAFTHEGQEIKLCCKDCRKDFDKDPAKFMGKVAEANKKVKPYKLETCAVSGEKLGDETYAFVYKGQEIKLCCKSCKKDFDKDPAKFTAKLDKK